MSSSSSSPFNGIDDGVGGIGLPFSSRSKSGNVTKSASCFGFGTRVERRVGPRLSLPLIGGDESRSESSSSSEECRRGRFLFE